MQRVLVCPIQTQQQHKPEERQVPLRSSEPPVHTLIFLIEFTAFSSVLLTFLSRSWIEFTLPACLYLFWGHCQSTFEIST